MSEPTLRLARLLLLLAALAALGLVAVRFGPESLRVPPDALADRILRWTALGSLHAACLAAAVARPALGLALLAFLVLCLDPVLVMLLQIGPADLRDLVNERTVGLLRRTIFLGVSSAAVATALGLPFGFLVARTDVPGAAWLRPLGMVPLMLPPLLLAMTWTVLTDFSGQLSAIVVLGLSTFPLVALFTARAFERIDARREEAALLAGGLRAVLRAELPLVLPASLCGACLAFAFAVNDFAVPDYVTFLGRKFNVYADEIFLNWRLTEQPGKAVASALPLIALTLGALLPLLYLKRRGTLATLGSDFVRPAPLRLGRLRWPAFGFAFALVSAGCLVPLGQLLWEASSGPALLRDPAGPRGSALLSPLAEGLRASFAQALDRSREDLRNSLIYSVAAASLCVPVGLALGHAVERARRAAAGRALEALSVLPLAAPAVLFGIGFVTVWNHDWSASFYGEGIMAVVLYAGRFAPFAVLVAAGAVASLNPALEESAALAGAGPTARLARVVAPSLRGSLLGAWVLVFVFSMRELDAAILVKAANGTAVFRVFNSVHFGRDAFVAALSLVLVFTIVLPGLLWTLFARKRLEVLP